MFENLIEGVVVYSDPFTCVSFNAEVLKQIKKYIQNNPYKNESGGLLLGYRHSNHFEITHITTPNLLDMVSVNSPLVTKKMPVHYNTGEVKKCGNNIQQKKNKILLQCSKMGVKQ